MTMSAMTSLLTNSDSKRSRFVHIYKAFESEVVCMLSTIYHILFTI